MMSREVNTKLRLALLEDKPMRYYLGYSSAFDTKPFTYHTEKYKAAVKAAGGKNVREARQFGWSNMPKVVTWTGNRKINEAIAEALYELPPFNGGVSGLPSPIIHPVR